HSANRLCRTSHPPTRLLPPLPPLRRLEGLPLPRVAPAVALREHVLALRLHRLARDHTRSDRRLDRNVEELSGNLFAQSLHERAPSLVGGIAMQDERQRVDGLAADEDVDPDELSG